MEFVENTEIYYKNESCLYLKAIDCNLSAIELSIGELETCEEDGCYSEPFEIRMVVNNSDLSTEKFKTENITYYEKRIEELKNELKTKSKELRDKQSESSKYDFDMQKRKKDLKKYDGLENLFDFIDGKITHYVLIQKEDYHYGRIDIITQEKAKCSCNENNFRLLTLMGETNGNLNWGLGAYSDFSGSYSHCIPCKSEEEAKEVLYKWCSESMKSWNDDIVKAIKKYDLDIDIKPFEDEYRKRQLKHIKDEFERNKNERKRLEEKEKNLKIQLDKMTNDE